jgi:hypothetical protein
VGSRPAEHPEFAGFTAKAFVGSVSVGCGSMLSVVGMIAEARQ